MQGIGEKELKFEAIVKEGVRIIAQETAGLCSGLDYVIPAPTVVRLYPHCPTSSLTREKSRQVSAPCRQPRQATLPTYDASI